MKYKFYDTDTYGFEDYDIIGEDYIELIKLCIRYSKTVCFRRYEYNVIVPSQIEKYRLPINETIVCNFPYYRSTPNVAKWQLYHFELSKEVCEWIMSVANSIWDWKHYSDKRLLEDPMFFREDGSVFFRSIIHEGEICIHPIDGEDVSSVVSNGHWHCIEG